MKVLNQDISGIKLLLSRKSKCFLDRNMRNRFQHWDEQFFDPNVVMLASTVIFGARQPKNSYFFAKLGVIELSSEF